MYRRGAHALCGVANVIESAHESKNVASEYLVLMRELAPVARSTAREHVHFDVGIEFERQEEAHREDVVYHLLHFEEHVVVHVRRGAYLAVARAAHFAEHPARLEHQYCFRRSGRTL